MRKLIRYHLLFIVKAGGTFVVLAGVFITSLASAESTIDDAYIKDHPKSTIFERNYSYNIYDNHDGTKTMIATPGQWNYKDPVDHKFKEIDTRLAFNDRDKSWEQNKASYHSKFPEYSDDWFEFYDMFEEKDQKILMRAVAGHVRGEEVKDGPMAKWAILYKDAFRPTVDYELFANNEYVQKLVVIREKPKDLSQDLTFDFEIQFPEEMQTVRISDDKGERDIPLAELDNQILYKQSLLMRKNDGVKKFSYLRRFRVWDSSEIGQSEQIHVKFYQKEGHWYFQKILSKEFLEKAFYPVYTDASATYYSGSGDGYVSYAPGAGTAWATVQAAATGDSANTAGGLQWTRVEEFVGTASNYRIYRAFYPIDTSGLADNAYVTAATFGLYGSSASSTDDDTTDYLVVVSASQASNTALATSDYSLIGSTALSDTIDVSGYSTGGYNTFTLNATGISKISRTGYTNFGVREGHDATNSAVTDNLLVSTYSWGSEAGGNTLDPKLTITYRDRNVYY